jgi:hypothetical protein
MKAKIGKYIDDHNVKYTHVDIQCTNDPEMEILALTEDLDNLLASNKTCTLEEFHSEGDSYLYTENKSHIKSFGVKKPLWMIVEKSGFLWNLTALMKHIYKLDITL